MKRLLNKVVPLSSGKGKVIVAGMPKSGTTAIAKLLAEAAQETVCSDPFYKLDVKGVVYRDQLFRGELDLGSLWKEFRDVFNGEIIKDPNFPLFLKDLGTLFPEAKMVFIVRDPRENIRSILSRLKIAGDPAVSQQAVANLSGAWGNVLNGRSPDMPGDDFLEKMAWRWRVSAEHYLENEDNVRLIRYEDFRTNKKAEIEALAKDLGYTRLADISSLVDVQFQPKGVRSGSLEEFFGPHNLERIEHIVSPLMSRFGYE
ncbi:MULTISPECIES: sulfotransferase family protein [Marinobacter]|uniref:sulfotransferase family protein n=1 Tax=Marinobacter TaxID=2742 RepID=UPI001248B014|nr:MULTISPECIES: sulfotransferase [Marinobacter]MBL3556712.1 sulfotransferase [Marinobacter sp. JB05H06]